MASKAPAKYDIVIIGAGPAGLSVARTLADTGLQIAVLEKSDQSVLANPPGDGRDIALTHSSEKTMVELGMWERIPATEIGTIRDAKVVNGKSPYTLHFDSASSDADYLGHIVPNHVIRQVAYESVKDYKNIDIICGVEVTATHTNVTKGVVTLSDGRAFESDMVIAADSRFSNTRRKMGISAAMTDFGRVVIVCEMEHEKSHEDTAFECFHYDQTLAVLPMYGNKSSVVVTLPAQAADAVLAMDDAAFAADIARRFDHKLGKMTLVSERFPYPLVGVLANRFVSTRFALIGDAAVGMHPVTAHGFNLGLTGASLLGAEVRNALQNGSDIGSPAVLKAYESALGRVAKPLYHGTNILVKLYTNNTLPGRVMRDVALRLGNVLPPVRKRIVEQLTNIAT